MEAHLLDHIDALINSLIPLHDFALLLRGLKAQFSTAIWDHTNEYRNFIHAFEPIFTKFKKNRSSNFGKGSKQYVKVFANGVKSAWEARAHARRHDIETKALPSLRALVDLVTERAEDREGLKDRVQQRADEKEKSRKRYLGRKKAKAEAKVMAEGMEAEGRKEEEDAEAPVEADEEEVL